MEPTREQEDRSISDYKERTVTASVLEGSIEHTSQECTPERVPEQHVVLPIRQNGGSQEHVQQHTVGQNGRHTGASEYSARALQLRAAYSEAAVHSVNMDVTGLVDLAPSTAVTHVAHAPVIELVAPSPSAWHPHWR